MLNPGAGANATLHAVNPILSRHDWVMLLLRSSIPFLKSNVPALGALGVKALGALLSLLVTFMIAKTGGAVVTGEYALAVATAMTASVFALAGLDQLTIRTVAGDLRQNKLQSARSALSQASRFVAGASAAIALLIMSSSLLAPLIGLREVTLSLAALAVCAAPLQRMAVAGLRANGQAIVSQIFDGFFHSLLLVVFLCIAITFGAEITSDRALIGYGLSLAIGGIAGWLLLLRVIRHWPRGGNRRYPSSPIWTSWPILAAGVVHSLTEWSILAQVGATIGIGDVGALRVALQFVAVIAMILISVETTVGADFAGDFRDQDFNAAKARHGRCTLLMIMLASPPAALFLIAPDTLLKTFGSEFQIAADALQILAVAQVINVLTGPVGSFLVMAGKERVLLYLSVFGLCFSMLLGIVLIPSLGITGAAIAFSGAIIVRNVGCYICMRHYLARRTDH